MNLVISQSEMQSASRILSEKCTELRELRDQIVRSFQTLKSEWNTNAGTVFFEKFEADLLNNLEKYSAVFEHMSENLSTSLQKYEEVFRAADAVSDVQY